MAARTAQSRKLASANAPANPCGSLAKSTALKASTSQTPIQEAIRGSLLKAAVATSAKQQPQATQRSAGLVPFFGNEGTNQVKLLRFVFCFVLFFLRFLAVSCRHTPQGAGRKEELTNFAVAVAVAVWSAICAL